MLFRYKVGLKDDRHENPQLYSAIPLESFATNEKRILNSGDQRPLQKRGENEKPNE